MNKIDYEIEDFMCYCGSKGLSKKTMNSYETTLKIFARYLEDVEKITSTKEVTKEVSRKYIMYLKERGKYTVVTNNKTKEINKPQNRTDYAKPIKNSTINNYIRNLKVYFHFMEDNYVIRKNPLSTTSLLRAPRKKKPFINDEEFRNLIKCLDTSRFAEYRDYIIIKLIFDTGMRIGETLAIEINDIDIKNRAINLRAETTKAKKARTVFFSLKMCEELKKWFKFKDRYIETNLLFPTQVRDKPLEISNFEKNYKKYCNRVNIKEASPHGLRNNFAKRCLMQGMDIYTLSRILGHSSVTVTEKCYLDLDDEDIRKNYQKYSPLMNLKRA